MTRPSDSLPSGYFADIYASDPDPWRFASSDYERAKYDATLASLPRERYRRALEVGCSIGVLTERLSARCDEIVALDVVPDALEAARRRCAAARQVDFRLARVPDEWPDGTFDLILLSEVVYYLARPDIARLATRVGASLMAGADIVLVHWIGETDYPLSGEEAADAFLEAIDGFATPIRLARTDRYRLDVLQAHGDGSSE